MSHYKDVQKLDSIYNKLESVRFSEKKCESILIPKNVDSYKNIIKQDNFIVKSTTDNIFFKIIEIIFEWVILFEEFEHNYSSYTNYLLIAANHILNNSEGENFNILTNTLQFSKIFYENNEYANFDFYSKESKSHYCLPWNKFKYFCNMLSALDFSFSKIKTR